MSFQDKVVIVTGASSGIGAASAILFAKEGANVTMVGRNDAKLSKVQEQCEQASGKKVLVVKADITVEEDATRVIEETVAVFGKIDVLVNNAGISNTSNFCTEDSMKVFDLVMNTNVRSTVYLTNLAIPYLTESKGNIVNVSSVAAELALEDRWAYCASKAALNQFARCAAVDLAPKGVRVNNVSPGPVKTDVAANLGASPDYSDAIWEEARKETILNKFSEPEEIADVIAFLASPKADSVTGSVYVIDNGMRLKRVVRS